MDGRPARGSIYRGSWTWMDRGEKARLRGGERSFPLRPVVNSAAAPPSQGASRPLAAILFRAPLSTVFARNRQQCTRACKAVGHSESALGDLERTSKAHRQSEGKLQEQEACEMAHAGRARHERECEAVAAAKVPCWQGLGSAHDVIRACTVCERRCGARGAQCRSAHSRVPPAAQDRWGACGERTALPCVSYGRKVSHSVSGARATRLQARVQHVPTSSQRPPRIVRRDGAVQNRLKGARMPTRNLLFTPTRP